MAENDGWPDDGGQAFPVDMGDFGTIHGMSMRDWFASRAIPQLMVESRTWLWDIPVLIKQGVSVSDANAQRIADDAYRLADAMLAERSKRHDEG